MKYDFFEESVFPAILENEMTCRLFLVEMERRGCEFSVDITTLTHDECKRVARTIWEDIKAHDKAMENLH